MVLRMRTKHHHYLATVTLDEHTHTHTHTHTCERKSNNQILLQAKVKQYCTITCQMAVLNVQNLTHHQSSDHDLSPKHFTREFLDTDFNQPKLWKQCRVLGFKRIWVTINELYSVDAAIPTASQPALLMMLLNTFKLVRQPLYHNHP